jgi:hypothetical protein
MNQSVQAAGRWVDRSLSGNRRLLAGDLVHELLHY